MLEAVTDVTAKLGYGRASVADVITAAGISRRTFYEQFHAKEDGFLTAYDVLSARLVRFMVEVGAEVPRGPARRRAQLEAFLSTLDREPAVARVFMVDVVGAGARALERRQRVNRLFADAVLGDAVGDDIHRTAIVGGVNNVILGALLAGGPKTLVELASPLAAFVERAIGPAPSDAPTRRGRGRGGVTKGA